ncbi:MAG: hypothetical protein V2I36_06155 [Desulfopila sp.]|jgi:hypothetical protein|nr:hypothetical protein [Desulfopila sp.]
MHLPEALRRQKENFLQKAPEEVVNLMEKATAELSQSGIVRNCLKAGDKAFDFALEDSQGKIITLQETRKKGPVILKFFRGDW